MAAPKKLTGRELEEFLQGAMIGNPSDARSFCERYMSPNYERLEAGGGRTNFEQVVEKVTFFRTNTRKWVTPVHFLVQEGNRLAARVTCELALRDTKEQKMELMFMAQRDEQGRFERIWELTKPWEGE